MTIVTLVTCKCPKRDIFLWKSIFLALLSSDVWGAHAIVSSFYGEQLKKCDSLYISKGIREFSCGVFIAHDLGDPEERKIHLNDSLRVTRCNIFVNSFCCMELKSDNKPILLELCLFWWWCTSKPAWKLRKANIACHWSSGRDVTIKQDVWHIMAPLVPLGQISNHSIIITRSCSSLFLLLAFLAGKF